jgi:phosphate starvation-inducible protein PhoH
MTEIFENDEKVGVVKFLPGDCVRNPLIEYMLNKIDKSL